MPEVHRLTHPVTGAHIDVEVPPTGLSNAYARSGWVDTGLKPEPVEKPALKSADKAADKPPAEPVITRPAQPSDKHKEN